VLTVSGVKSRGFFVDGSDYIVGVVVAVQNDLAKKPIRDKRGVPVIPAASRGESAFPVRIFGLAFKHDKIHYQA
jgi:hypothetical protein